MPGVSKEQIAAAKQMTAIEFLRRFRPNELVKSGSRGEFQLREHDSFKINGESSIWHWKSRDIGGKSALDYLIKVEGMKFVDAVLALCDECPGYTPHPPQQKKRPEFILPPAAVNNRRVFAYLLKRGISRGVIEACVRAGILYESADYHIHKGQICTSLRQSLGKVHSKVSCSPGYSDISPVHLKSFHYIKHGTISFLKQLFCYYSAPRSPHQGIKRSPIATRRRTHLRRFNLIKSLNRNIPIAKNAMVQEF